MAEPAFDRASFEALAADLGEDPAREASGVFFATTRQYLDALATGDSAKNIVIKAHAIKSSAAAFGFLHLAALARQLEHDAAALSSTALAARVGELQAGLARARADLDDRGNATPRANG